MPKRNPTCFNRWMNFYNIFGYLKYLLYICHMNTERLKEKLSISVSAYTRMKLSS